MSETIDCTICFGTGKFWQAKKSHTCELCDGREQITLDELNVRLADLVEKVAGVPKVDLEAADPGVAMAMFQEFAERSPRWTASPC